MDLDPNLRLWALNLDQGGVMAISRVLPSLLTSLPLLLLALTLSMLLALMLGVNKLMVQLFSPGQIPNILFL